MYHIYSTCSNYLTANFDAQNLNVFVHARKICQPFPSLLFIFIIQLYSAKLHGKFFSAADIIDHPHLMEMNMVLTSYSNDINKYNCF